MSKNQAFKNENRLLDSPEAPLEQAHLHTNLVANTGEGRESNWAAKTPHLTSNAQAQISTLPYCRPSSIQMPTNKLPGHHQQAVLTITLNPILKDPSPSIPSGDNPQPSSPFQANPQSIPSWETLNQSHPGRPSSPSWANLQAHSRPTLNQSHPGRPSSPSWANFQAHPGHPQAYTKANLQ